MFRGAGNSGYLIDAYTMLIGGLRCLPEASARWIWVISFDAYRTTKTIDAYTLRKEVAFNSNGYIFPKPDTT